MGGLDPAKLLVILVLALVVLGPERLPKAARQVGAFWRDFTAFRERIEQEVRGAMPDIDLPDIPVIPKSGLTGYLTGMMRETDAKATPSSEAEAGRGPGSTKPRDVAWKASDEGSMIQPSGNPSPVMAPNGIPAGWSSGSQSPGFASGSNLSPAPGGAPEAILRAEARLDLDDPSWN